MLKIFERIKFGFSKKESPKEVLCSVTFIYDSKGYYGAGKGKRDSMLAWVEDGATKVDIVKYFSPPGVDIKLCTVTDIIVDRIPTLKQAAAI